MPYGVAVSVEFAARLWSDVDRLKVMHTLMQRWAGTDVEVSDLGTGRLLLSVRELAESIETMGTVCDRVVGWIRFDAMNVADIHPANLYVWSIRADRLQ